MAGWFDGVKEKFILNFITDNRWKYLGDGLVVTLEVTLFALIIGVALGFLVGSIRSSYDKREKRKPANVLDSVFNALFGFLNAICKFYLTVIRGTPVAVQLMIIYFVIFASVDVSKVFVAVIAFGINSGAYVAEIVRAGIMSVDRGQMEAGRSLGFNYVQTMQIIVVPQAFKNVLPALGNELITLLKETSICGFIALQDLTKGGGIILGVTYDALMPLIAVALIYLAIVMLLSKGVSGLERRLRSSDH